MMRKITLLFFVFAFSLGFAQLIDYDYNHHMGPMYQYLQMNTVYFTEQDVRYHLETELSIPSSQSERWLSGSGSYDNIQDGDVVCEGLFYYDTFINARADMGDFDGMSPFIGSNPGSWTSCGSGGYSSCPQGNQYVIWGNGHYGDPASHTGSRTYGSGYGDPYRYRSIDYRETTTGPIYSNKVSDVATVLEGTASLRYWRLGGYSIINTLHTFDPLSGTQSSDDGSFSIWVTSSGEYLFLQRLDVTGGTIVAYNVHDNNERFWSYDTTGSSQSKYTRSNIHDDATITVVDEDDVGVVPPSIIAVDMGADGPDTGPFVATPGEVIPVILTMYIPDKPNDDFYPLQFEFYDVGVNPTSFSFDETSGVNQCSMFGPFATHKNGGWLLPYHAYTSEIEGTLTVPGTLAPGAHTVQMRVHWRTCSNQEDCNGNGYDEWTDWFEITVYIPDDELPDLICEIEPITYVDGIELGTDGEFAPGEGVEDWRVTITNIGIDEFEIPGIDTSLCSGLAFQAYSSDGIGAFSPFYSTFLTSSFPDSIGINESITFDIEDGTAICVDETGQIEAEAWVNYLWYWYPYCVPFTPMESNFINNYCEWEAPCGELGGPGDECTIIPSLVTNPPSESIHDFDLFCDGSPCTGTVVWGEDDTGDDIADMTASDQLGATAQVTSYEEEDDLSGITTLTATVGYPDDMVCNATIILNEDGPGDGDDCGLICEVYPSPQPGAPGSYHEFFLRCQDDEDPDWYSCAGHWDIVDGDEYVLSTNPDLSASPFDTHWLYVTLFSNLVVENEGEEIRIRAYVDHGDDCDAVCYGTITLPPMDCFDYI